VFIAGSEYKTETFSRHFQAFEVIRSLKTIVFNINQLAHYRPFNMYSCLEKDNKKFFLKAPSF